MILALFLLLVSLLTLSITWGAKKGQVPVSVNFHFTRRCNKTCGFCFHTAKTSHVEDFETIKHGLSLLKKAGLKKINMAGGEPFLYRKLLGQMVDYCKETLHLESVSIVTNGSLVTADFLRAHGRNIDILAVSCDSFHETTNIEIGRGSGDQVPQLYRIADWCRASGVKFKINTVVCKLNCSEDMNRHIAALQPFRWKCFQVLILPGENDSDKTLRDGRKFAISDDEYEGFCRLHRHTKSFVAEPNWLMASSYLILDEYMRFLDKDGSKTSESILKVGVRKAMASVLWDEGAFVQRGGVYDWTREQGGCPDTAKSSELEW